MTIDDMDQIILKELQLNCRISLKDLAKKIPLKTSAIHYRIEKLRKKGIIEGFHAKINASLLGENFYAIVLIQARYGPEYLEDIGKKLASITEVKSVYYCLGENDFIVKIRAQNQEHFMEVLREMRLKADIERTNSIVIANIIKEDNSVHFDSKELHPNENSSIKNELKDDNSK